MQTKVQGLSASPEPDLSQEITQSGHYDMSHQDEI